MKLERANITEHYPGDRPALFKDTAHCSNRRSYSMWSRRCGSPGSRMCKPHKQYQSDRSCKGRATTRYSTRNRRSH